MIALLIASACTNGSESPPTAGGAGTLPGRPLPRACDLVTASDVETAIGAPASTKGPVDAPDRCRYVSEHRDEVEITLDRPGSDDAVGTYRKLNPDAEQLDGIGEDAALRVADGAGELLFVEGGARFFVVITGRSFTRNALLSLAEAAAKRL